MCNENCKNSTRASGASSVAKMEKETVPASNYQPERRGCSSPSYSLLIRISLVTNIVVLIPVCLGLIVYSSSGPVIGSWGPPTPARGILLSVYISVLVMSALLLGLHSSSQIQSRNQPAIESMVAALLTTQILYKITTPATAGATNPVAVSNLCISALHAGTLFALWKRHTHRAQIEDDTDISDPVKATLCD